MSIEFRCTECGTMLRVDEANRGKMARCPKCSMINAIPTAPVSDPPDAPTKSSEPPETIYYSADSERWSMRGIDGTVYGPVRLDELRRWYDEGRINQHCSVQRVGDAQWQSALDVLAPSRSIAPEQAYAPIAETPVYHSGPYAPHSGNLIIVMACIGTFFFPCALIAAIMGHNELKKIKRGVVDPSGESLVRAGFVIGLIFSILGIFPWICCCIFPAFTGPGFRS